MPTTSSARTTTSRTSPSALRISPRRSTRTRRRFAADPTQLGWDDGRVIHARTRLTRGRLWHEYIPGLHLEDDAPANSVVPTVSAHGAAMLVRRSMLLELGCFDESFFMEWEDLDLCWRAWSRGWPSVYVPEARLRHRVGGVTTTDVHARRSASSHHNLMRFALKCLPAPALSRASSRASCSACRGIRARSRPPSSSSRERRPRSRVRGASFGRVASCSSGCSQDSPDEPVRHVPSGHAPSPGLRPCPECARVPDFAAPAGA